MQPENAYIEQLRDQLKEFDPYLVLLFGSYANGTPDVGSDIDLLVVTNDEFMPNDFKEHSKIYLKISSAIRPVKKQIPVDLIVYTLPMYRKFIEQNSSFASEIATKGKIIYARDHSTVA